MPFQKGVKRAAGAGRKKGVENKATKDIKEAFKKLVEDNLDNMTLWLERVAQTNPAKASEIMLEMSKRFVPTMQSTQVDANINANVIKIVDESDNGANSKAT